MLLGTVPLDAGTDPFPEDGAFDVTRLAVIEDNNGDAVFHAVVHGLRVHDLQVLVQDILIADFGVPDGVRIFFRILGVDPIHFGSLEDSCCFDFASS